jgi:hypothetical protein
MAKLAPGSGLLRCCPHCRRALRSTSYFELTPNEAATVLDAITLTGRRIFPYRGDLIVPANGHWVIAYRVDSHWIVGGEPFDSVIAAQSQLDRQTAAWETIIAPPRLDVPDAAP